MALQHARFACEKHEEAGSRHSRSALTQWMRSLLREKECVDPRTNIANTTELADRAAHHADHNEWLDDPDHWIWDASLAAAELEGFGDHA